MYTVTHWIVGYWVLLSTKTPTQKYRLCYWIIILMLLMNTESNLRLTCSVKSSPNNVFLDLIKEPLTVHLIFFNEKCLWSIRNKTILGAIPISVKKNISQAPSHVCQELLWDRLWLCLQQVQKRFDADLSDNEKLASKCTLHLHWIFTYLEIAILCKTEATKFHMECQITWKETCKFIFLCHNRIVAVQETGLLRPFTSLRSTQSLH